jgi:hypothetical protein
VQRAGEARLGNSLTPHVGRRGNAQPHEPPIRREVYNANRRDLRTLL